MASKDKNEIAGKLEGNLYGNWYVKTAYPTCYKGNKAILAVLNRKEEENEEIVFIYSNSFEEAREKIERFEGLNLDIEDYLNVSNYYIRAINEKHGCKKPMKRLSELDVTLIPYLRTEKGIKRLTEEDYPLTGYNFSQFLSFAFENIKAEISIVGTFEFLSKYEDFELPDFEIDDPLKIVRFGWEPWSTGLLGDLNWMRDVWKELGDFYIVPSSVSELLICSTQKTDLETLKAAKVGADELGEVLSRKILLFDGRSVSAIA